MNANELMIGDYIRQKISGFLFQVDEIHPPFVFAKDQGGQFDDIEPATLTSEILEKNGFELNEQDTPIFTVRIYSLDTDNLALIQRPKGGWKLMYGEVTNSQQQLLFGEGAFICMPVNYVHELQHALRLAGIYKEIVL